MSRLIVVLGMHRSGTSLIASSLQTLGVDFGNDLLPPAEDNPTGFWEDRSINQLNEEMLSFLDRRWFDLRPLVDGELERLQVEGFGARAAGILQSKICEHPLFALKDPRMSKLMGFWRPVFERLDIQVSSLLASRNPVAVAHSLQKRNQFAPRLSALLWLEHNLSCIAAMGGGVPVVDYDAMVANPGREVRRLGEVFGLEVDPHALADFEGRVVRLDLNHSAATTADLTSVSWCPQAGKDLYAALSEASLSVEPRDDLLKSEYDKCSAEFAKMDVALNLADELMRENLTQRNLAGTRAIESDKRGVDLESAQVQIHEYVAMLADRDRRIAHIHQEWEDVQKEVTGVREALAESRRSAESSERALDDARAELATVTERVREATEEVDALAERYALAVAAHEVALQTSADQKSESAAALAQAIGDLGRLRGELQARDEVVYHRNLDVADLQRTIEELFQSTSWRVTRPLRAVREATRPFVRKAQRTFDVLQFARRWEGSNVSLAGKVAQVLRKEGVRGIVRRIRHLRHRLNADGSVPIDDYAAWLSNEHDPGDIGKARSIIDHFETKPLISILMPTYDPDPTMFRLALDSVVGQIYENWELCIADDCSDEIDTSAIVASYNDQRFKYVRREENGHISAATNSALELATGDYITLLDHDDELSPFALFWVTEKLNREPMLKVVYSDEDKIDEAGNRCDPHFKPDWNYDYLLGHNYICHLTIYTAQLFRELGGPRLGYEGAQDYDLVLRAIEQLRDDEIGHIPRILYHWRKHAASMASSLEAKPYALDTGRRAVVDHLARTQPDAQVTMDGDKMRVQFGLPEAPPKVSLIVPTKDAVGLVRNCIDSVLGKTIYPNFEILLVDNNSSKAESLAYFDELAAKDNVSVLRDARPFNFAAINNRAVAQCDAELVCLLNNDVEVIDGNWLSEMVANLLREDVGAVGARLLYSNNTIQHAGVVLGVGGVAGHAFKCCDRDDFGYFNRIQIQHQVSAVTGACLLVHRQTWEAVGGMDEAGLAVAFNDVDFCLKVRAAGYKIVYSPFALLYHHESATRGFDGDSPEKLERLQREAKVMNERWGYELRHDPAYNPNLTIENENFTIAAHSRNLSISQIHEGFATNDL